MPKISGYREAKDKLLTYIAHSQPKQIDRAFVASLLSVSISTAGNYLSTLAEDFPENLQYVRGVLLIFSSIPEGRLPVTAKMEIRDKKIEAIKAMGKKIESNHLTHNDAKLTKEALQRLLKELETL